MNNRNRSNSKFEEREIDQRFKAIIIDIVDSLRSSIPEEKLEQWDDRRSNAFLVICHLTKKLQNTDNREKEQRLLKGIFAGLETLVNEPGESQDVPGMSNN